MMESTCLCPTIWVLPSLCYTDVFKYSSGKHELEVADREWHKSMEYENIIKYHLLL